MFQSTLIRIAQVCLFAGASLSALAATYTIQGNAYVTGAATETVTASFTTPTGGTTTRTYSGYVLLSVLGTGTSNGTSGANDAFYFLPTQTHDSSFFQLAVDSADLVPNEPLADVVRSIAFDVDANSEVRGQPYLPLYRNDHTYQMIIDTSLLPSHGSVAAALRFGVSDATFADNSGTYSITVTQLTIQSTGTATQSYVISTVAGNGIGAFLGDGGPATQAELRSPGSVAIDSQGRLYISDGGNNRIRMVANGTITTIAGANSPPSLGDGGPATSAFLSSPGGITVDPAGNLYIADTLDGLVRKVTNGTISTIAGDSTNFQQGYSGDGGAATSALLLAPSGVALDTFGNLFIADQGNNVIREISNGVITTFGSDNPGALKLKTPAGVAVDTLGNVIIADKGNHRIVKATPGGAWSVIAGTGTSGFSGDNGPANKANLSFPGAVAVDSAGQIYIADSLNSRIRLVSTSGIITTIAGTGRPAYSGDGGPATSAALFNPPGLAVDAGGNVYVADANNERIRFLQAVPLVFTGGVVNAASFTSPISPGALATVFGSGFAASTTQGTVPLPTKLGGVSVTVNNQAAPILYVTPNQVNFQVPSGTPVGTASVTVSGNNLTSGPVNVPVLSAAPGLFFQSSGQAIVQNQDSTLNGPGNPARTGSTIVAYGTGSGPLDHAVSDGAVTPFSPLSTVTSASSAAFSTAQGSTTGSVAFAGLTPGFIGLLQMNIVVPSTLSTGDYLLTLTINGQKSNAATVSVTK